MIKLPKTKNEITTFKIPEEYLNKLINYSNSQEFEDLHSSDNGVFHKGIRLNHTDIGFDISKLFENGETFDYRECKFDYLYPDDTADKEYLSVNRMPNVEPTHGQRLNPLWATLFWHADTYCDFNSYKCIIYLNDVTKDNGAISINKDRHIALDNDYTGVSEYYDKLDDISDDFIEGVAGTAVIFSCRILHRINIPKQGYRHAFHIEVNNSKIS